MPSYHDNNSTKNKDAATAETPEKQLQKNVDTITQLEEKAIHKRSTAERLATSVAKIAGSLPFIILHICWFGGWLVVNLNLLPGLAPFDPFPFSFLGVIVALETIFLSLLVLMNQNRMAKEADQRAHLQLQINMLSEQQTTSILGMLQRICDHLGLDEESDAETRQMMEKTDVHSLAKALADTLPHE